MAIEKKILIIPGDGIGSEVTQQSLKVLKAIAHKYKHQFQYQYAEMGAVAIEKYGTPLPAATIELALESDAILFGTIGHPKYDNDPTASIRPEQGLLELRRILQLYANIRPVTVYPSMLQLSPLKESHIAGTDLIIYRELTGGIYFGNKTYNQQTATAADECVYSKTEIERIAVKAFKHAQIRRKKLCLVDKANVLETSRLWRSVVQELSAQFPDVQVDYLYIDNALTQMLLKPQQFDIILTENLFGDIMSFEANIIAGSLGLASSCSVGNFTAMFEPIHGSYPAAAGKDIANPIGSILSTALMMEYFGLPKEADIIREGVNWTLKNKFVTKDIDPINFYFTSTIGDLVSEFVITNISDSVNHENIELRKSTVI